MATKAQRRMARQTSQQRNEKPREVTPNTLIKAGEAQIMCINIINQFAGSQAFVELVHKALGLPMAPAVPEVPHVESLEQLHDTPIAETVPIPAAPELRPGLPEPTIADYDRAMKVVDALNPVVPLLVLP